MDIWSFGFLAYKILTGELPSFNATRAPVLKKTGLNPIISDLLTRCLSVNPAQRPTWEEIDFKNIKTAVKVE
jgi:serine/threonine protein kinase